MITTTQAQQYIEQALGVVVPVFIVQAAVDKVTPAEAAMVAAGYSPADRTLVQSMAVAVIAATGPARRLTSQNAASGASRSFKYADGDLAQMRRALAALDTAGTVTKLVGADPAGATLLMVVA